MNHDVKQRWVTALRSGKYKQTRDILADPMTKGYCCLGVLCALAEEENVVQRTEREPFYLDRRTFLFDGGSNTLPDSVMDWASLTSDDPIVDGKSLSKCNDELGYDFHTIALLIEESDL